MCSHISVGVIDFLNVSVICIRELKCCVYVRLTHATPDRFFEKSSWSIQTRGVFRAWIYMLRLSQSRRARAHEFFTVCFLNPIWHEEKKTRFGNNYTSACGSYNCRSVRQRPSVSDDGDVMCDARWERSTTQRRGPLQKQHSEFRPPRRERTAHRPGRTL